jgi:alkylation response protein AidB-like acyl-CoA dehydrogenase
LTRLVLAGTAKIYTIFDGASEIQRLVILAHSLTFPQIMA